MEKDFKDFIKLTAYEGDKVPLYLKKDSILGAQLANDEFWDYTVVYTTSENFFVWEYPELVLAKLYDIEVSLEDILEMIPIGVYTEIIEQIDMGEMAQMAILENGEVEFFEVSENPFETHKSILSLVNISPENWKDLKETEFHSNEDLWRYINKKIKPAITANKLIHEYNGDSGVLSSNYWRH